MSLGDWGTRKIRFRSFEVDFGTGELRKGDRRVRLRDKSLEVLAVLLEQPGKLVSRSELRVRLWPSDVFVDFENNINCAVSQLRYALGDSAVRPRYIETLPRKGYRFLLDPAEISLTSDKSASGLLKILVLPFQQLGESNSEDHLSDGVTEEMIVRLGASAGESLKVIARATAMTYKTTCKSVAAIGRELGVNYLVEGRLLRTENRVRINASIVNVPDGTQLWSTSREGKLSEILILQRELADAVAGRIRLLVPSDQPFSSPSPHLTDPDTYDAYLRGRALSHQLTRDGLKGGISCFREALLKDPSYAPGWASLAASQALLGLWGYAPQKQVMPEAERAARKAIELNPQSALAHSALGTVYWFHYWYLALCEQEYEHAVQLSPGDSDVRWPFFVFLSAIRGDHERAIREARLTEELDPASVLICANVGWVYYWARRYDDAVAQSRKALEMRPDYLQAHYLLGASQLANGRSREAVQAYEKASSFHQDNYSLASLAMAWGFAGEKRRAADLCDSLRQKAESSYVPAMCFAVASVGLGDHDRVFEWMERAYGERDSQLLFVRASPAYDSLRSDPRFGRLLALLGMPPHSR